ncbi:MAG: branched-chain amino acid transaminase [archaeon]|nr:branched-chain amino acid transaminase [archaeon]
MSEIRSERVWMNGKLTDWDNATVHIMAHALHYGSSVFEGIRCYNTKKGPAIFRLNEHTKRLIESAKIYRMQIPYTQVDINSAIKQTIRANNLKECYIRPLIFKSTGGMSLNPLNVKTDTVIAVWSWGAYLGEEALEAGIDVKISSWSRMAPNTHPGMAKAGGNYINSQLAKIEAVEDGYAEAIMLNTAGFVAEGSGENIFMVKDKTIYTPQISDSILPGITRDSIIKIAKELNYEVKEVTIPREMLYLADELFFTGTAAEVTPIRSVDKISIGEGTRGPITKKLQGTFFGILKSGQRKDWFEYIDK